MKNYLKEKLSHLDGFDAQSMSKVLRDNSDLFYKEGNKDIGCSSKVKHEINTGNIHPVKGTFLLEQLLRSSLTDYHSALLVWFLMEPF